ncbi:MAG: helix-turn-helix transcriptional regulator [Tannerellaceae bacterium]|nr:helix-turn-helix transcriptional regulator [Tannerellaceae bacterium]
MNNILQNIDEIRRKKGYSQEYVAQQIRMKQSGFSLIMSGGRELKYNTLLQIAKALQENVIDIITYPEKYTAANEESGSIETTLQIRLDKEKETR